MTSPYGGDINISVTTGDRRDIGRRIRLARKLARLTQDELAERSGLAQSFISMLETGKCGTSQTSRDALATGLGISALDIFHDDEAAVA